VVVVVVVMIDATSEHAVQGNLHKLNILLTTCNIFREITLELNCALETFQHKENTHELNNEACTFSSPNIYGPTCLLHFPNLIN
jgi:hypothetical protein